MNNDLMLIEESEFAFTVDYLKMNEKLSKFRFTDVHQYIPLFIERVAATKPSKIIVTVEKSFVSLESDGHGISKNELERLVNDAFSISDSEEDMETMSAGVLCALAISPKILSIESCFRNESTHLEFPFSQMPRLHAGTIRKGTKIFMQYDQSQRRDEDARQHNTIASLMHSAKYIRPELVVNRQKLNRAFEMDAAIVSVQFTGDDGLRGIVGIRPMSTNSRAIYRNGFEIESTFDQSFHYSLMIDDPKLKTNLARNKCVTDALTNQRHKTATDNALVQLDKKVFRLLSEKKIGRVHYGDLREYIILRICGRDTHHIRGRETYMSAVSNKIVDFPMYTLTDGNHVSLSNLGRIAHANPQWPLFYTIKEMSRPVLGITIVDLSSISGFGLAVLSKYTMDNKIRLEEYHSYISQSEADKRKQKRQAFLNHPVTRNTTKALAGTGAIAGGVYVGKSVGALLALQYAAGTCMVGISLAAAATAVYFGGKEIERQTGIVTKVSDTAIKNMKRINAFMGSSVNSMYDSIHNALKRNEKPIPTAPAPDTSNRDRLTDQYKPVLTKIEHIVHTAASNCSQVCRTDVTNFLNPKFFVDTCKNKSWVTYNPYRTFILDYNHRVTRELLENAQQDSVRAYTVASMIAIVFNHDNDPFANEMNKNIQEQLKEHIQSGGRLLELYKSANNKAFEQVFAITHQETQVAALQLILACGQKNDTIDQLLSTSYQSLFPKVLLKT